ncbi:alpha/beta hydrolase, partial [Mesorhizobium sp. M4A.F.Ca.ET.029.04.2.1]
ATRYAGAGDHVSLHWVDVLGHRRILADKGVVERAVCFAAEHRDSTLMH